MEHIFFEGSLVPWAIVQPSKKMTQTIEFLLMTASRSIGGEVVGLEDWNTGNPWKSTETGRSRLS